MIKNSSNKNENEINLIKYWIWDKLDWFIEINVIFKSDLQQVH